MPWHSATRPHASSTTGLRLVRAERRSFAGPAEFGAYVAAETDKWAKVVKFAGIKPE